MSSSLSLEANAKKDTKEKAMQRIQRAQWLRAAILGANDGLLSTASLMLGVGAAKANQESMIISGLAGAFAGACSMAVGEFASVSTQRDIEKSMIGQCSSDGKLHAEVGDDIKIQISTPIRPTGAGSRMPESYLAMSAALTTSARPSQDKVSPSIQLGQNSPCNREQGPVSPLVKLICERELLQGKVSPSIQQAQTSPYNFSPSRCSVMREIVSDRRVTILQEGKQEDSKELETLPNPYKAAAASAMSFLCGSLVPILSAMVVVPNAVRITFILVVTSIALILCGGLGAFLGGSPVRISAMRVLLGGWISMSITYGLLKAFDNDKAHDVV